MDSDCLIKLTKANLKELVCRSFAVFIPDIVKKEVIDNAPGYPDAEVIKQNIDNKIIRIKKTSGSFIKGEDGVLDIFQQGGFDAICSDDKRFIRRLRIFDIPYIPPSVFIPLLLKRGKLNKKEAEKRLHALAPYISNDEYYIARHFVKNWRAG